MSGIPYNELQDVNCTVNDTDGTPHVIATLHYSFVIPCWECRHMIAGWCGLHEHVADPDGFCAWGERRDA